MTLREPVTATLFIKPSQFVISDMVFDKQSALEGSDVNISVTAWNEGNYASDVLVVFYIIDPTQGDAYATPEGVQRLTRIANTTVPLMAPKAVLENAGAWPSYTATATWENVYIPVSTTQDYEDVKLYAMINPAAEQVDIDAGIKAQDEYLNEKDDNDASGHINIVKDKSSTPSFAIGLIGMSVAALIAAIGTSLRREEE